MKVSVIVPTYHRAPETLSRALTSLLNQSYEDVEIVVVDDNPPESEYRGAMEKYFSSGADKRIVYHKNARNMGGSLARNEGIAVATGEYITFLDDDDEYLSDKIRHQVDFMEETGCDLSFEQLRLVNANGETVDFREFDYLTSMDNDYLLRQHLTHRMTGTPTFMFKAEALRNIGGFDDAKMGQEFLLMLKSIKSGLKIRYLSVCDVVAYRGSEGGISYGSNKLTGENFIHNVILQNSGTLSKKEKRHVNFRHEVVMAVGYARNKSYFTALARLIKAFFTSPADFFKEGGKFLKNVSRK